MRKVFVLLGDLAKNEDGQAVIEYVLMVSVTVAASGALAFGLRKTLFALWQSFSRDITAACPGCPPDPSIQLK
jgi:Flp pilus assembly pilin Flp